MNKSVLKRITGGALWGCAMFACALLMIDAVLDSSLAVLPHQYTRIILGAICMGVGFALSALVYEEDRIPFWLRTLIHFLLCAVVLLVALIISGGIPNGTGFGTAAVFVLIETSVGLVFWIGNLVCFFREARRIKKKLWEQASQDSSAD